MIWTVMKLKLKIGFYRLRTVANFVWKIKSVKLFNQKIFHTNNNSQRRSEFSKLAYRYCDGLYCKCEKRIMYITATSPILLTESLPHSRPTFP